jgi:hypothetical protein
MKVRSRLSNKRWKSNLILLLWTKEDTSSVTHSWSRFNYSALITRRQTEKSVQSNWSVIRNDHMTTRISLFVDGWWVQSNWSVIRNDHMTRFTDSDYPFGIFKLFLAMHISTRNQKNILLITLLHVSTIWQLHSAPFPQRVKNIYNWIIMTKN